MPRLNGKSSHGSNPMTRLSRTLSWMPHCWPQKQQCVLTSLSGSTAVESRSPDIDDRCGPKRAMILSSSVGIVATMPSLLGGGCGAAGRCQPPPLGALCQPEQRAPALGADVLVMTATRHVVV